MNEPLNQRISRSGLSIRSSPIRGMANTKDSKEKNITPTGKAGTSTNTSPGVGAGLGAGTGTNPDNTVMCSMQDIWGFLTSLQNTIMKQSEDIAKLSLKNQELEHKNEMQDMKILLLEEKIQTLQTGLDTQSATVQDTLTMHEGKLANMDETVQLNVKNHVGQWVNAVRNGTTGITNTSVLEDAHNKEEEAEYNEQEKRKMNIVIRGITESDKEQVLTLNASITDMISEKFGMHDVVVYGAHRVGKKKPDINRAIVCTLLDARKRSIILENARIYLKDSPLYVSEDRTPKPTKSKKRSICSAYE